jgi:2Fe-2S ferredoxin
VTVLGGTNPYIEHANLELPKKPYKITILRENSPIVIEVDPAKIPYGPTGQPGSILDIAMGADVGLEHVCGGVCACSTCHVKVKAGLESCNEATDDELDQLDEAPDISLQSRLGCQCVPNGTMDVVVEIPAWNKNLVREGH